MTLVSVLWRKARPLAAPRDIFNLSVQESCWKWDPPAFMMISSTLVLKLWEIKQKLQSLLKEE